MDNDTLISTQPAPYMQIFPNENASIEYHNVTVFPLLENSSIILNTTTDENSFSLTSLINTSCSINITANSPTALGVAYWPYPTNCIQAASNTSQAIELIETDKFLSPLSPAEDILIACYLVLLEILAVIFNGFVIGLSVWKRKTLKSSDSFVVCLAMSDIGHPLSAYPLIIASSFRHAWIFGDTGCTWNGFTGFFFGINSMMTLAMMSLNRLIIITNANFARHHGKLIAFGLLSFTVCFALFWSLSPLLGWGKYGPEPYKTSCTLVWDEPDKSYVTSCFVACLAVPSLIMIGSYGRIVYLAALMRHRRLKWSKPTTESKLWEKKEMRLLKVTGVMCFTFLLFWMPYAIVSMIKSYGSHIHLPVQVSVLPAMAAKTSHVIDPLIYCALNKNFSQHIPQFLKREKTKYADREYTTQSIPLKTVAVPVDNVPISSEA